MAPPKRQKLDRESNAAYAASQPLFDALRTGAAKVYEQRIHLLKARDTVQQLHIKLVDINNGDDAQKHDHYMDATVKAWRSATEAFSNIFQELCKISAPDTSEGREAGEHHEQFRHLAATAAAAQKAAMSYRATVNKTASPPVKPGKRVRVQETMEDATAEQPTSRLKKVRVEEPSTANQRATRAQKPLKPNLPEEHTVDRDDVPPVKLRKLSEDVSGAQQLAHKLEKARQRPQERKQKEKSNAANSAGTSIPTQGIAANMPTFRSDYVLLDGASEPSPASVGKEDKVPNVEYEDVSAEVAARLKAKGEKKRAKNEQKKRKRESGDSALVGAHVTTGKPSKRRANTDGVGVAMIDAAKDRVVKRKQEVQGAGEVDGGAKKRRKGKA